MVDITDVVSRVCDGSNRTVINVGDLTIQRRASIRNFGPGTRTKGVIAHIRKEVGEIEDDPSDIFEWADLIILSFDGAMRQGFRPEEIIEAYHMKRNINDEREWPDWRKMTQDQPIEHVRND